MVVDEKSQRLGQAHRGHLGATVSCLAAITNDGVREYTNRLEEGLKCGVAEDVRVVILKSSSR